MLGGLLGATGAVPNLQNGAGSPISSGATSGTGDQSQKIGFHGGSVNFGNGGGNNQLLIIGGFVLLGIYLLNK
ncbi:MULTISPECIES: hypothetical protein [unclassified Pseudoalteromonas]|uniref:hypothetical protein n=1 Tax=unclassified Pseudoalteromonas TaxID=194690 RepID=UPI0030153543